MKSDLLDKMATNWPVTWNMLETTHKCKPAQPSSKVQEAFEANRYTTVVIID